VIGVVVPVRDQAAFLGEALDSIAAQTLPAAEVIVVDDGSTDGSADVARARGVRTITTPGLGPGAARNAGAAALDTPLLAFLDADDRFTPDHHRTLSVALGHGDAAIGKMVEFLDADRVAALGGRFSADPTPRVAQQSGTLLIRRTRFTAIGGFGADPACNELFELYSQLDDLALADVVVLERRIHGANRTIVAREAIRAQYLASARAAILRRRGQP
jgi:glycosyltransferase involved in cell wall biosynthesis